MWIEKYPDHRILLLRDFNAKSRVWGKRNTDERGNQFLSFCNNLNLSIENSPELPPTYDSTRGHSWIDLLITKNIDHGIELEEFIAKITTKKCFGKKKVKIILDKKNRAEVNKQITKDRTLIDSIQDSIITILKYHFPYYSGTTHISSNSSTDPSFLEISPGELEAVIHSIKLKKASGLDGIPGEIVKEINYANPEWFRTLLNNLLRNGEFPTAWKTARIALIPKKNRDLTHPKDFRPICILPCWGKVLDKMLAERLAFFLESKNLLHNHQFGFR
ncbi:hypothetical protein CDAR_302301 [Caerostris darwini]|uniref:Endonuclease/exonuclease/phosphatase domain-containing protein n=1 Tax=Caerostris darwini TaxID=1538125 RepID=A0AAV4VQD6_9ARAC|nr:hypothetical protein CDAR_302301 [Caerostris darwini]